MPFATLHRNDATTPLPRLGALTVARESDPEHIAALQGKTADVMRERFDAGHRVYVAYMDGAPAAWGWVATRTAVIGELDAAFSIPNGERYLWNFVTLPSHRGLGIYPRLLQAIVHAESSEAERFWIAYAPENHASGAGITKAGFSMLAEMSFDASGRPALYAIASGGANEASHVLGLPASSEPLAPCWRCVRAGRVNMTCADGTCLCDYQRPISGCAS